MSPVEQLVSFSAEKIEGSDDLLTKILLFLPARPLFRFKLVSKRWMSLISDPRFSSLWKPESFPSALILESSSGKFSTLMKCLKWIKSTTVDVSMGIYIWLALQSLTCFRLTSLYLEMTTPPWKLKYYIDRRKPTLCGIQKMICSWPGFTSSYIKLTFTMLSLISEANQQLVPYLALYMPCKVKFTVKGGICEEFPLPSVHHLIENPFWIGSKLSNIGQ
ncbi:hypothetical protein HAX54_010262 [Datura stramonium]|uniref:F-box domain-containing protein n=1 Tax=Datura stramonium TaxID=4076 RepID=A0ABS8THT8_DATST|nr:hypothetical protein [Datura stramonium]